MTCSVRHHMIDYQKQSTKGCEYQRVSNAIALSAPSSGPSKACLSIPRNKSTIPPFALYVPFLRDRGPKMG